MEVFWPESKHDWLGARCNYQLCVWLARDDGIYLEDLPHRAIEGALRPLSSNSSKPPLLLFPSLLIFNLLPSDAFPSI
ncbi:hypothetical protein SDJN02_10497, partial [Cucurbita argyrosperma subsp. argyrosperma]